MDERDDGMDDMGDSKDNSRMGRVVTVGRAGDSMWMTS